MTSHVPRLAASPRRRRAVPLLSALLLSVAAATSAVVPLATTANAATASAALVSAHPPLQTCTAEQTRAAQRWWAFGNGAGIDFGVSGNSPTAVSFSGNTNEGSTVVTDTTGQMIFWSNGSAIFNRNNDVMPNGTGLQLNASATQTVAAFPSLSESGVYFVVTNTGASEAGGTGRLYYSKVDLSLDGGLGAVTATKNVPLGGPSDAAEALTAIPNADGTGFWVVTHRSNTPFILAYEFDGNGPTTGVAVESQMSTNNGNQFGTYNVSADLTQVVQQTGSSSGVSQVRLLDFDAASGVFDEKLTWNLPVGAGTGTNGYSADFSPHGDYVYATKIFGGARLFRYHVAGATTAAEVEGTMENLAAIGNGGQVRRAPDGKMYVVNRTSNFLHVVTTPDAADPGYVVNGFQLAPGTANGWGLPQTVTGCPLPPTPVDLSLTKIGVANDGHNGTITWTLTVHNAGSGDSTGFTVVDDVPASVSQVASSTPGCDVAGNTVTCTQTELVANDDYVITITGKAPATGASVDNTAALTSNDYDPDPSNNTVTTTTTVNEPPTVSVNGPGDGATYFVGQDVTADYGCSDPDGSMASCVGDVPNGGKIDTSTPGSHDFDVTGTDNDGATTTKTSTYRVVTTAGVCRGTPLAVLTLLPATANPATTPCKTDSQTLLKLKEELPHAGLSGLLGVLLNPFLKNLVTSDNVIGTTTSASGLAAATATVDSTSVTLPGLVNLSVTGVQTKAQSKLKTCSSAELTSSSKIASLTLNGKKITVGTQPLVVPLVVGALYVNHQVKVGNTVSHAAVFLDLPGTLLDIKIAEATAGVVCN
jgi:hypothetical protein